MAGTAVLDQLVFEVNGTDYSINISTRFTVTRSPDSLSWTASFGAYELDQLLELGADVRVGARVRIKGNREGFPATADEKAIFCGILIDKIVIENTGTDDNTGKVPDEKSAHVECTCVDDTYRFSRHFASITVASETVTKDLFAFFKDDGSGAGAPTQYVRKAELREFNGSYFIPWEDMDNIPPHSFRRKKDDEPSVYLTFNEYVIQYQKKELVFSGAQVDNTLTPPALPSQYVAGTPDPPSATNQDWVYKMVASFFVNPLYPSRNTSEQTVERVLRRVLAASPLSDSGGGGFSASQLDVDFSYTKGADVVIPDRIDEGMLVTLVSGADVTVSDGAAWAGKTTIYYVDTQGVPRTGTISSILGDVLTLSAAPTNLIANSRIYGCDQLGVIVTIDGLGESTYDMANYTDVTIDGVDYFIREIRDDVTLVLVNVDETGDFSAMPASGTLTYHTIEWTGLQINRYRWDKDFGPLSDMLSDFYDKNILPVNYHIKHVAALVGTPTPPDVIRGRTEKQYEGVVVSVAGPVVGLDDVDGFLPLHPVAWWDATDSRWRVATVESVDYSTEELTLSDATNLAVTSKLYANCRMVHRHVDSEHGISLDNLFLRTEISSTANQSFPVLDENSDSILSPPPTAPVGSWTVITGDEDSIVDDTATSMYLLRWTHTGSGQLEGDPEQYGMTPVPWPVVAYDSGQLDDYDQVVLQIGYIKGFEAVVALDGYRELPMFSVECSDEDVALASVTRWSACCSELVARMFDPANPNDGQLNFKCDLIQRFRHIRILCDRPHFYKVKDGNFGIPTRSRAVPIVTFQLYKRPRIRYNAQDETLSTDNLSPNKQIDPHIGEVPFAQITNKGGDISLIAVLTLTVGTGHNFEDGDTIEFWDTSADAPFAGSNSSASVASHTATTITVSAIPAGLAAGDKVGIARRWLQDVTGTWRDLLAKTAYSQMFENVTPVQRIEDESAQNGWDAQQIAVTRQWDSMLTVRDGKLQCKFDPHIELHSQVVSSGVFAPEMVMGIAYSGFEMSLQLRSFNRQIEEIATGTE